MYKLLIKLNTYLLSNFLQILKYTVTKSLIFNKILSKVSIEEIYENLNSKKESCINLRSKINWKEDY